MLQRIQTVYLLIIAGLMTALFFLPLAVLQSAGQPLSFDMLGLTTMAAESKLVYPTWGLALLAAIIVLLAFITVFLFKKRILQMRLCVFNAILMVGFYAMAAFFIFMIKNDVNFGLESLNIKLYASFPAICIILDYLAIRNIGADEALVRSLERLR